MTPKRKPTKARTKVVKAITNKYSGLPGVRARVLRGPYVRSPSAAIRAISDFRVCSMAGDDGAITVWRNDVNVLCAEFSRYLRCVDRVECASKTALRLWLKKWWPLMQNFESAPTKGKRR